MAILSLLIVHSNPTPMSRHHSLFFLCWMLLTVRQALWVQPSIPFKHEQKNSNRLWMKLFWDYSLVQFSWSISRQQELLLTRCKITFCNSANAEGNMMPLWQQVQKEPSCKGNLTIRALRTRYLQGKSKVRLNKLY